MNSKSLIALFAASLLLCACEQIQSWTGEAPGSASAPALDAGDNKQIADAMQRAYTAPIGQQLTWNNADSGHAGTITPIKDGYSDKGAYCREFQQIMTASGSPTKKTYNTACQQPDGSWKAVSQ